MPKGLPKKITAVVLVLLMLVPSFGFLLLPKPAKAVVPVVDIEYNPKEWLADPILKGIAGFILQALVNSVKDWIQSGDFLRGGGPLFVTNFDQFMLDAADEASGIFLKEYVSPETYNFLCTPFRAQVYRLTALGLAFPRYPSANSFRYKARCTVSDIVGNVEDFYQDFENGGWEAWVETALYANNPYGLLSLTRADKRERELRNVGENRNDFETGAGFIASSICLEYREFQGPPSPDGTPPGKECVRTLKETIGSAVKSQLESVNSSDVLGLNVADEVFEIIFAALNAMLTSIIHGPGGLLGAGNVRSSAGGGRQPYIPPPLPDSWTCDVDHGGGSFGGSATTDPATGVTDVSFGGSIVIKGTDKCKADQSEGAPPPPPSSQPPPSQPPPTPPPPGGNPVVACNDGIDNDGDGFIDLLDQGCTDSTDTSEGSGGGSGGGGTPPPPDNIPPPPA
ncbi:MAG: hypothetical protein A2756_06415 [Candidatus Ryanbacteria bacterium RIFCSPHIGHO2_01_FULL_48_27]|uniref:Uncharacterized protein n=1 Tax=Candidatus Ryanbacteria bacterium RIFCSPHIGHO2_01_FULL_48_27 TaxID=1802115 RepID=A0A1G2G8K8_9BACT|nr:MAG: hypothetical protein A2756_06415 [Candidatus Ryanbacteria bacterium RIFCSPHIGHO2_01_FULL_48_27]